MVDSVKKTNTDANPETLQPTSFKLPKKLLKALRLAGIEVDRTNTDIVAEAITLWIIANTDNRENLLVPSGENVVNFYQESSKSEDEFATLQSKQALKHVLDYFREALARSELIAEKALSHGVEISPGSGREDEQLQREREALESNNRVARSLQGRAEDDAISPEGDLGSGDKVRSGERQGDGIPQDERNGKDKAS